MQDAVLGAEVTTSLFHIVFPFCLVALFYNDVSLGWKNSFLFNSNAFINQIDRPLDGRCGAGERADGRGVE